MDKKTIDELRVFVQELVDSGVSKVEIGRKIEYSRSQVDKFLNGGTVSDKCLQGLMNLADEYEVAEKASHMKVEDLEFIRTRDAAGMLGLLAATEKMNGFSAILGNAGTGKTETTCFYANKVSENAVYIRCNCLMATRDILQEIGKACGFTVQMASKSDMFNDLVEQLMLNPKMLIFDEVDQIMPSRNINKIETIRNLHDIIKDYGNSMVLVGSRAVEHLFKRRSVLENYGQIDSRIDYMYKTQGLQESELHEIVAKFNISDSAKAEVVKIIDKTTKGGIRWLTKILKKCVDIADLKDGYITKEIVTEATQIMML